MDYVIHMDLRSPIPPPLTLVNHTQVLGHQFSYQLTLPPLTLVNCTWVHGPQFSYQLTLPPSTLDNCAQVHGPQFSYQLTPPTSTLVNPTQPLSSHSGTWTSIFQSTSTTSLAYR